RERPAIARREAGKDDVLFDVEAAEDTALLVHQLHACSRNGVTLLAGNLGAVKQDRAIAWRHHAHQTLQCRALPGAVAAEQSHDFVPLDVEGDVKEDVAIPVIGVQTLYLDQAHSAANTPCTPPR